MKDLKSAKFTEAQPTPIATPISTRYCDRCHLSTPKSNPRCIHCRCLLAPHISGDRLATRVA